MSQIIKLDVNMNPLFSNRHADAFAKTVMICGTTHVVVFLWLAVRGDPYVMNIFHLIGLHLLIPGVEQGWLSFTISYMLVWGVYIFVYLRLTGRDTKDKS